MLIFSHFFLSIVGFRMLDIRFVCVVVVVEIIKL